MRISVIVPALDEAAGIRQTLVQLHPLRDRGTEVLLVDGGSTDGTPDIAAPLVDRVIRAARGRAIQMNAGAAAATGEILLFLHADTILPPDADRLVREALGRTRREWGRFDVHLEGRSAWLPIVSRMMNLRSRLTGIATGDQAIFVTREAFAAVGGFPPLPLMEDLAISDALLARGRPICLGERVVSSGRRWDRDGGLRTILLMWRLRTAYRLGADPADLAARYRRHG